MIFFAPIKWMLRRINQIENLTKRFIVLASINMMPGLSTMFMDIEKHLGYYSISVAVLFYLVIGEVWCSHREYEEHKLVDKLKGKQ